MISLLLIAQDAVASAPPEGLIEVFTKLLNDFGVNKPFFIAQVINFFIVLIVLKFFAFAPIQKMLEERKTRIADGEEKLKQIDKQLAESEATTAATIEKANADAKRLIEEARESADKISEQKTQEAVASAQGILAKAKEAAEAEKSKATAEIKKEFGRLVTMTTANVTGKVLTDSDKERINEESLVTLNN